MFLSKHKLDSRRRLSEDLIEPLDDLKRNSVITDGNSNEVQVIDEKEKKKRYKLSFMFCKLMKSKMYLVGTFTMAVILYVSTGIQFWLTKYYIDVLGFSE
jgi:hypothetical protein